MSFTQTHHNIYRFCDAIHAYWSPAPNITMAVILSVIEGEMDLSKTRSFKKSPHAVKLVKRPLVVSVRTPSPCRNWFLWEYSSTFLAHCIHCTWLQPCVRHESWSLAAVIVSSWPVSLPYNRLRTAPALELKQLKAGGLTWTQEAVSSLHVQFGGNAGRAAWIFLPLYARMCY